MSSGNPLLKVALDYANRGWHVFPCTWIVDGRCSCAGAIPNCSPGKHPLIPDGFYGATTDPLLIEAWWKKFPLANVAIRTGAESGIAVLDVDDSAGWGEIKKLLPEQYDFRSVPRQKTGKPDGWHLLFRHPGHAVKNGVKIIPGVDVRGDGGYIIAAPSMHISGNQYKWKYLPPNEQFPSLPPEIVVVINDTGMKAGKGSRFDPSIIWEGIPEGKRDDQLFRYACQLRYFNAPHELADRLIIEAAARCNPPFPERRRFEQSRASIPKISEQRT